MRRALIDDRINSSRRPLVFRNRREAALGGGKGEPLHSAARRSSTHEAATLETRDVLTNFPTGLRDRHEIARRRPCGKILLPTVHRLSAVRPRDEHCVLRLQS